MAEKSNDTFISYRRDVGGILAMALWQNLSQLGIDVFYDIESIRAGEFGSIIFRQIEARPYFVLLLTPKTLDRCSEPDDWLRKEIEHAVATERVIIPAHTPNFDFGDCEEFLVGGLGSRIRGYQAQELPQRWFKFAVQQLAGEYLLPIQRPTIETPASDQPQVDRIRQKAEAASVVTSEQLSAQEYFERALGRTASDLDGAVADYSEAIRLDPRKAIAFNNRGFARWSKGDLDGAIADYNEAIRLDPQFASAFSNRGSARGGKGDLDGEIADCNEAIRLDPRLPKAFNNRGFARWSKGDLDGAIADSSEAIRLDPQFANAFNNRGLARAHKGDLDGAIADYNEAIRLNPQFVVALNNRALARDAKGDTGGARTDRDEAKRLAK
jgi:tetratricopeptide (TPR) repeat protein